MPHLLEWSRDDTRRLLRRPERDDDKNSRGVVALRTGSDAYPGAAVLGVEAAWRAGCGYVRFSGSARISGPVLAQRPETVVSDDADLPRVDAWVIGSGTDARTRSAEETALLRRILDGTAPVVVDAGALDLVRDAAAPVVATPHAGEFGRLREDLGLPVADLADELARGDAVAETAAALGAVVLLKGARTLVSAGDEVVAIEAGTPWLATAGTGDVLAGMIGALAAAAPEAGLVEVGAAAAWLHGAAGRLAAGITSGHPGHPIVALDVAQAVPRVIGELAAVDAAPTGEDRP